MHRQPRARLAALTGAAALVAALAACGSEAAPTSAPEATAGFPVTIENCDTEVSFDAAPQRVILLKAAPVTYLHALGVMDRVVARAGQYPAEYYDEATQAEIDAIPLLTDRLDTSGHLQISKEVVIAEEPDLVLGEVDNLSRETLAGVGIPLIEEPTLCATSPIEPGFEDIFDQMRVYGEVFGRSEEAAGAIADLEERLAEVQRGIDSDGERTAAVLYPTVGGGITYAYGTSSMAHPQVTAAGFTNVFGDVDERVFEVTLEELLGRDPDVLILLHSEGTPEAVTEAITTLPGAEGLTAVRNGDVLPLLFNFTEPASPLAIEGLEKIAARFGR